MRARNCRLAVLGALVAGAAILMSSAPALAGFAGTDLFIPFAGRATGQLGSNWYTTVWIYNPNNSIASVEVYFLPRGFDNRGAVPVIKSVAAGETLMIENIVETEFGKTAYGALRLKSDLNVVASARVYSKAPSAPISQSFGQDFAAVPPSFAIGLGESTQVLGGYQTVPTNTSQLRYNFGCVEVTGATVRVKWTARDANGVQLGTPLERNVKQYDQLQGAFKDYFPGISTTNARVTAEVISGAGKVIVYGSAVTNDIPNLVMQDPTTFESIYPPSALTSPHLTGLFHGAVWSTDGLVVEGGIELEISSLGVVSYSGSAGLQCGDDLYTLDLADTPASALALDADGDFTGSIVIAYEDGGATVFTTTWTLNGNRDEDGIVTGTLLSTTTGGTGDWATCNGASISRAWRAGWTKNP
jgi:hypothetical protein